MMGCVMYSWLCMILWISVLICLSAAEVFTTEKTTSVNITQVCLRPSIPHGEVIEDRSNFTVGETVQIYCEPGYRTSFTKSDTIHIQCREDGEWRDLLKHEQIPKCERIGSCPAPTVPHSAVTSRSDGYMPDSLILMSCEEGYSPPPGRELIRCRNDGTWEIRTIPGMEPVCEETNCQPPDELMDGKYEINLYNQHGDMLKDHSQVIPEGSYITYTCNYGFRMSDRKLRKQICNRGRWNMEPPKCIKGSPTNCGPPQMIEHGKYMIHPFSDQSSDIPKGHFVIYTCDEGYSLEGKKDQENLLCLNGKWEGNIPRCIPEILKECRKPPNITNGNYLTIDHIETSGLGDGIKRYTEGVKVYYYCDNGYKLTDKANASVLVCTDWRWEGSQPFCERRTHCDQPQDILNGNWVTEYYLKNYGIGTKIRYDCMDGYKAMGTATIECLSSGYWSDYAPRCLAANKYCSEPGPLENGVYMCRPSHCDLFKVGTEVHYVCNKDHDLEPPDMLMQKCRAGGIWSGVKPQCKENKPQATSDNYMHFNASTLTVVIATSCGVLGLLVVIMVVVALQRRKKPRLGRLCHPSTPPPPPYNPTPPTGLVDDPDRVALIAFADGVQVVLPSYEEAIRSRPGSRLSRYASDRGSTRSSSSRDYRPLPSLPQGLRNGGPQIREIPPDHHRNSIITTASITTRDNLSLALGSIDTMNISDGTSTSVTVDTASSNPSIATSQRAAAGSIESSSTNGSLATEDAPLLDQNHYNTETLRSHHSNVSDSHPHNHSRCQCTERIGGYDTLRSQGSRSQSESSPIVEVPEEQKDA